MLRVLIANDDGINASGLRCLAARLAPRCEIVVVAPQNPQSATGHAITMHKPLRIQRVAHFWQDLDITSEIEAYHCSGTPSDCVAVGLHHIMKDRPPQLVLSGINNGRNVAQDLPYSGTLGAALEGAVCGVPSLALSLDIDGTDSYFAAAEISDMLIGLLVFGRLFPWHAESAADLRQSQRDTEKLWRLPPNNVGSEEVFPDPPQWAGLPGSRFPCINVNIPDRPLNEMLGICWTNGGNRRYLDVVTEAFDPRGKPYYWIGGTRRSDNQSPGTDINALQQGYVSVSPVTYDITSIEDLDGLAHTFLER